MARRGGTGQSGLIDPTHVDRLARAQLSRSQRLLSRVSLRRLPARLADDERLAFLAVGLFMLRRGLLAVTDRRALFTADGVGISEEWELPFDRVERITATRESIIPSILELVVAGKRLRIEGIAPDERLVAIAAYVEERIER